MNKVEFLWIGHAARREQKTVERNGGLSVALRRKSGLTIQSLAKKDPWPCAFSLMDSKDGEFGCFERMKRKEISRVKAMAEIAPEMIVWEGCEVTGPIGQKLKCLLSMIQVPNNGDHMAKNRKRTNARWSFSTGTPREFRRNRGHGRMWPPQWRSPTGSVRSRQNCRGSRGWDGRQRKLVSLLFHFWRFFSIIGGRCRCSCGSTPWAKVEVSAIFNNGYSEMRFALRFFSVNSQKTRYPENSGF